MCDVVQHDDGEKHRDHEFEQMRAVHMRPQIRVGLTSNDEICEKATQSFLLV